MIFTILAVRSLKTYVQRGEMWGVRCIEQSLSPEHRGGASVTGGEDETERTDELRSFSRDFEMSRVPAKS